jgi:hypothetical protein
MLVVVESSRRWEGRERKSQPTSKVFGRALMGVMNEGAVGQTATDGCMVVPTLHDSSRTALLRYMDMTVPLEKVNALSGCVKRGGAPVALSGCVKRGGAPVARGAHSK